MATSGEFQEFLSTLKEKLNIVDVISGYMSIERRGGNWWGCCPFHHEKTPSFAVNEADQYYHCFGCGESGDVIKFVREMENVEFMDAVKLLAERVKLPVPQAGADSGRTAELKRKKDVVLNILRDSARFYLNNLNSGNADEHIDYILQRKIPAEVVRKFGLGASLNFKDLPEYLLSKGYSRQDIIDSGAVNEADKRLIDAQGGRLIFPIINAMDEVIAFGGRLLRKATDLAKYKNTRETAVFNKSKSLYNINLLKKLRKTQTISEIIMVEGYMDTISLYGAGFKNVVASMGTSLTQDQARLVKRYSDNVLISYDGDGAGQKANMRGLEILKSAGVNVKVVPLPEGLDPDDVIKQRGAEGYKKCLESALPLIDYKLQSAKKGYDLERTEDKRRYVAEAVGIIKTADSAAEQEELLKRLRDGTGISYESLKRDLEVSPAERAVTEAAPVRGEDRATGAEKASRYVIAAYLFGAQFTKDSDVSEIPFTNEVHSIISKYVGFKRRENETVRPAELLEMFDEHTKEYEELCRVLDYNDGETLTGEYSERYFNDCVKTVRLSEIDKNITSVRTKINGESDLGARKALAAELQRLINLKEKIKGGR